MGAVQKEMVKVFSFITMRAEHSVLWVSWQGHTGSLQLLHKQLVQVRGRDRTHIQTGLGQERELCVPTRIHPLITSAKSGGRWGRWRLTVAGVLCCRLAPNVPSNQSFRLGRIRPLSRYLQCASGHFSGSLSVQSAAKLQLTAYQIKCCIKKIYPKSI